MECTRVGQNRKYIKGSPEPYVYTVHDLIFGDFPARIAAYTPYICGSGQSIYTPLSVQITVHCTYMVLANLYIHRCQFKSPPLQSTGLSTSTNPAYQTKQSETLNCQPANCFSHDLSLPMMGVTPYIAVYLEVYCQKYCVCTIYRYVP